MIPASGNNCNYYKFFPSLAKPCTILVKLQRSMEDSCANDRISFDLAF